MINNSVKLKVIGCGDAFGSGGRLNTCYYVEAENVHFLVDCGASSLPGLKKHNLNVNDIDAVLITHFHGDHYGGIPFLLLDAAINGRQKKIQIISPHGGKGRIVALLDLLYPGTEVISKLNIEFLEYSNDVSLNTGDILVKPFEMKHTPKSLPHGLRIEVSGKVLAYSGDTSWTDALLPLSESADLFICECNFYDASVEGHMNYLGLLQRLPDFSYKRILLTHLDQQMLDRVGQLDLQCLSDGMEVIF